MSNVFLQNQDYSAPVKRNPYDLQRLNNGTFRSGIIYPVGWDEVGFGDSIRLSINAGLRTLPMPWPIQTPIIAKFYTFYVRFRTLQKNFTDFRFGNKPIIHPYISLSSDADFWKTGELGDYLGIPTTYASDHNLYSLSLFAPTLGEVSPRNFPIMYGKPYEASFWTGDYLTNAEFQYGPKDEFHPYRLTYYLPTKFASSNTLVIDHSLLKEGFSTRGKLRIHILGEYNILGNPVLNLDGQTNPTSYTILENGDLLLTCDGEVSPTISTSVSNGFIGFFASLTGENKLGNRRYVLLIEDTLANDVQILSDEPIAFANRECISYDTGAGIMQLADASNPFSGSSPEIPLSAMPCRAYEAIYRSHFQDLINEPFILDGEPQYNRYITNDGDGPDSTDYKLKHRNWEADRFTSCKPSPQQGLAPIVGVNSLGDIVLQRQDGQEVSYSLTFDKDGLIDGWNERVAGQANGDPTIKRRLLDLATTGFTINALRDVNSYQLWKEATYRKSPKFKDQVRSVFGVDLEYKELDMPEFLGGFDMMLNVNEITQTSSSVEGSPLGDLAGRGSFVGRAKHSISHYCDEEGIVMSVMCITPIPVYSQMLDRKWLKSNPLDYYNPQFGKIGNQAVTYEEVCPVQAYNEGVDVHDVFGYQRPWYHYISSYDEVHGLFRDSMNGFVMQRIFGSTPELGKDFLHIDESQLNEVFIAGQGQDDTFYGQINYDCKIKRGIPRVSIPSLE